MNGPSQLRQGAGVLAYTLSWVGFLALLLLMPVRYGTAQWSVALGGLILFAMISAGFAGLVLAVTQRKGLSESPRPQSRRDFMTPQELRRLVLVGLAASTFGFLCLLYDRVFVQGVDFSQGLAAARYLWRNAGEGRQGVSSLASMAGYFFGFFFFAAVALAQWHWENLDPGVRAVTIISAVVLVLGNSLLTGGRSIILMQLATVAATATVRVITNKPVMPGSGLRALAYGVVILALAIGYSLYVFSDRAAASGIVPSVYAVEMIGYLGGSTTEAFHALDALPLALASTLQFAVVAGSYLTHSAGTFESVLDIGATPGAVTFTFIIELLAKLGLVTANAEPWILGGRFLTLPGSLWYDFGWSGVGAGAILLGLLIGLVPAVLAQRGLNGLGLGYAVLTLTIAFMAPLLLAVDVLAFPFICIGFLGLDLLHRLFGAGSWGRVGTPAQEARVTTERT